MLQELFRIPIPQFFRGLLPFLPRYLPIYGYGLMLVIGFLLAIELAKYLAHRKRINADIFVNAGLVALLSGVIGSRLSHIIENWSTYTDPARSFGENFLDAINISSGGLTFYGGLILAIPVTALYLVWKKVPLRVAMDIGAPAILIGLGIGRVGCLLNGCCYGSQAALPWSVSFPYHSPAYIDEAVENNYANVPPQLLLRVPDMRPQILSLDDLKQMQSINQRLATGDADTIGSDLRRQGGAMLNDKYRQAYIEHAARYGNQDLLTIARGQHSYALHPAQLYSTITALLLAAVLVAYFTMPHAPGRVFALMLIFEGFTRYLLEMLRVEPPVVHVFGQGLSLSMVIGAALVGGGVILWFALGTRGDRSPASAHPVIAGSH